MDFPHRTLSELVQHYISSLNQVSDQRPEVRAGFEQARNMIMAIVNDLIASRETLTDSQLATVEELVKSKPEMVKGFLDEHFTRNLVVAVPGYVDRLLKLSRLKASTNPSATTNVYLREAVRTYVLGLPQASVVLSRAALEQALKEKLGKQLSGEFITFQELLKEARRCHILDHRMERCARDVANAGDDVLHDRPTDLPKALEVFNKLRGILQHIYSVEGHY
jgi:hypothetical protein